ncbi:hypothetical protein KJ966_27050 [bacterium]|nr:hypothetical protein [bacterium]
MLKKALFSAFLVGFALTANAQIATPQLDTGFHSYSGAAAGWRYNSSIDIVGLSAEGKTEYEGEESGDVKAGLPAKGPDESGSIPFLLAAYRGETWGAELYTNLTSGLNSDIEIDLNITGGLDTMNIYKEEKEKRLNLAYVFGEMLSVGLGYSSINLENKYEVDAASAVFPVIDPSTGAVLGSTTTTIDIDLTKKFTTTALGLSASLRMADMFFIAAGMENVNQTGTYEQEAILNVTGVGTFTDSVGTDYVENSWTNTMYGLGVVYGEPDETQFRMEYSVISSPKSEKDADGDKKASDHPATTTTFATLEVKWNNVLIAYQNEVEKEEELNDNDSESVTTLMGLGWQPMEGLTVSLYSFNREVTMNVANVSVAGVTSYAVEEIKVKPSGFRIFLGYNF